LQTEILSKFGDKNYSMSANTLIDRKINDYLVKLNNKEKKAVLGVVKSLAEKHADDEAWDDEAYNIEMNRRFEELETGKVKGLTLDELEAHARQAYKNKKAQ